MKRAVWKRIVMGMIFCGVIGLAAAPSEASAANGRLVQAAGRAIGVRLYYSNAFRGLIPGTGYGGFRRPAFGYRGY